MVSIYVDFYPGADKPYLVTTGNDKTVKKFWLSPLFHGCRCCRDLSEASVEICVTTWRNSHSIIGQTSLLQMRISSVAIITASQKILQAIPLTIGNWTMVEKQKCDLIAHSQVTHIQLGVFLNDELAAITLGGVFAYRHLWLETSAYNLAWRTWTQHEVDTSRRSIVADNVVYGIETCYPGELCRVSNQHTAIWPLKEIFQIPFNARSYRGTSSILGPGSWSNCS